MDYQLCEIDDNLRKQVVEFIVQQWGSPKIISRCKVHSMDQLPGIVILRNNTIIGLLTYKISDGECEIVSLDSLEEDRGLGSQLISEIERKAKEKQCHRIWLITTNDNIQAIKFYQTRGYDLKAVHRNAVESARKLKAEIPLKGYNDIPIKHELEFEKWINL
jgi:ribosomal protein S18 acetylase RimI-like enzyme